MTALPEARTRAACIAIVAVAALAFALLRAPYLSVPLERDEGEYAYIAQRMLEGDVPYRDAFDQKPPGVFLVYAAAFAVLGQSIESIHLMMYLWTAATAFVLFALLRRLAGELPAAFAALVFSIAAVDPRLVATAANTEIFMLLPMVAATHCMLRGLAGNRWGWWLACGLLSAAACWIKQVAAANLVFIAVFAAGDLLSRRPRPSLRSVLRVYALLGLGGGLASAPVLLYFAFQGAWGPFIDAVLLHNLAYSQDLSTAAGLRNASFWLARQAPSLGAFWALALCALVIPRLAGRRVRLLLAGWALASLVGVSIGLHFRPHYFIQLLPALAALCGVAVGGAARWLLARPGRGQAWAGLAALVLLVLAPPVAANWGTLRAGSPNAISRKIYGLNPFPESLEIANYIRSTSEADDSVYVVGSEPQILFYAERRSATRYIFFYPLTARFPDAAERQREVMREVTAAEPRYVVMTNLRTSLLMTPDSERFVFEETARWLSRHYRLEFMALPRGESHDFEFVYGAEAKRLVAEAREKGERRPWIAVYRRVS
jgi:4-amino-4-deoxy-L-arabinose transferase-like glycosyltransferase